MRIVCIYTQQIKESRLAAQRCVRSGSGQGYRIELYPSVYWEDMDEVQAGARSHV